LTDPTLAEQAKAPCCAPCRSSDEKSHGDDCRQKEQPKSSELNLNCDLLVLDSEMTLVPEFQRGPDDECLFLWPKKEPICNSSNHNYCACPRDQALINGRRNPAINTSMPSAKIFQVFIGSVQRR